MKSRNQRLRRGLALATVVGALAAPAAWAAPIDPVGPSGYERPPSAYVVHERPPAPVTSSSDGFDWGDAGIGATAILALGAIAAGATVALRTRPREGHTVA